MPKKVVIVGGVAGGASAAARLRRLDEEAEIILFERGDYISFANCGLPYYIGGVIKKRDNLLVQTVEGMQERFNIDIRVNSEVTKIYRDTNEVEVVSNGQSYKESYDYLILAPGAEPIMPGISGVNRDGIYTLRNMADVDRIKSYVAQNNPQKAAVIGGGYIGIEMMENLKHLGLDVTFIEASDQIMNPLDLEMARIVEKKIIDKGVKLVLNDAVESFEGQEQIEVVLESGNKVAVDLVIMAIGVKPEIKLAKDAGLEIGERGGIKVDPYLRTSDQAIYAVGDAIEVKDFVNGEDAIIPLAGPANKQGRIAADNICERNVKYKGSQGTSILKVFDMTAAATGNNEKTLIKKGIPYIKSYIDAGSHAGYYPGATLMVIKLLFSPIDGKILGAQIVGNDGVDKRMDVLAAAIRLGGSVYDLEELELAYAPPYSSAKDPVNMASFVAANILKGDVKILHWEELGNINKDEYVLLDVRTLKEYQKGHVEGALHIPLNILRKNTNELPQDKKIIIYCKVGLRGYIAYRMLSQKGFDVYNISGGYDIYQAKNYKFGEAIKLNEQMTELEEKNI